jgi:hypothetical protein
MRAQRRNSCPATYAPRTIVDRVVALCWRWTVAEYPGMRRGLGDLIGLAPGSARHLMAGRRPLTARHAERLASFLESDLGERRAVIDELRAHAAQHDARVKRARAECMARAHEASRQRRLRRLRQSLNG